MKTRTIFADVEGTRGRLFVLAATALMTAVTCIVAPLSIPIGPIPISLATLAIYLSVYILGWKYGTVSVVIYLLLGMAGLPVFSNYAGGLQKLVGPTGGYLFGYIPLAVIAGIIIDHTRNRFIHFAGLLAGTAVLYAFGTAWFCIVTNTGVIPALSLCVFPFIPGDLAKMLIALILGGILQSRLSKVTFGQ